MKLAFLFVAGLFVQTAEKQPTAELWFIGQTPRMSCRQVFPKLLPKGVYTAVIYVSKDDPDQSAVAVVYPAGPAGIQRMTIAYPYGQTCPLVVEFLDENGKPAF